MPETHRYQVNCHSCTFVSRTMKAPISLISGGTRGIGARIRDELLIKGHSVIYIGSTIDSVLANQPSAAIKQTLKPNQFIKGISIDFKSWPTRLNANWNQVIYRASNNDTLDQFESDNIFAKIDKKAYKLDLLVNCAGITQTKPLIKTTPQEMQDIMNVNFMSAVSLTQLALKHMIRNPLEPHQAARRGTIINISSVLGDMADPTAPVVPGTAIYSASKAAMIQQDHVIGEELKRWKIEVRSIAPSLIPGTDMIQSLSPEVHEQLSRKLANLRRESSPDSQSRIQRPSSMDEIVRDVLNYV